MKRYALSVLSLLVIFAALGAWCTRASAFSGTYDGPIETVAIVMENGEYVNSRFEDVAYDQTVTAFYGHPHGRSRFDVVERKRLESIVDEQTLVGDSYVASGVGPQLGNLLGAQYLVFAELTRSHLKNA